MPAGSFFATQISNLLSKGQSPFEKEYDLELQRRILSRKEGSGPEKPIYLPTTFV
jgi:hypothetical protein